MEKEQVKILIFPDVHGRTFWKEAVRKFPIDEYPDLKIIFLGDYLDPYESFDGISPIDAFINFEDILDFSKKDNRVILLIGNHDWHYFVPLDMCRIDRKRMSDIGHMFTDNIDMFKLVETVEMNNNKYIFSHAGFTRGFVNFVIDTASEIKNTWKTTDEFPIKEEDTKYQWIDNLSKINLTNDYNIFNKCLSEYNDNFYSCLPCIISRERGGFNPYGSMIWADVHEHIYGAEIDGCYQIFGHTYGYPSPREYIISPNGAQFAMLDCGKPFVMDVDGNIEELKME